MGKYDNKKQQVHNDAEMWLKKAVTTDKVITENNKISIPLDKIDPNPDNSYIFSMDEEELKFLAAGIEENGYNESQPIGVFEKQDGRYEIYNGERRYRAMKMLGRQSIPAVISKMPTDPTVKARLLLESNNRNRAENSMDLARELNYYIKEVLEKTTEWKDPSKKNGGDKYVKAGENYGISKANVLRHLQLLKLIPDLQNLVAKGLLPIREACRLPDRYSEEQQKRLYNMCMEHSSSTEDGKISESRLMSFENVIDNEERRKAQESTVTNLHKSSNLIEGVQISTEIPLTPNFVPVVESAHEIPVDNSMTDSTEENAKNQAEIRLVPEESEELIIPESLIRAAEDGIIPTEQGRAATTIVAETNMPSGSADEDVPEIGEELKDIFEQLNSLTDGEFRINDINGVKRMISVFNKRLQKIRIKLLE